MKEKNKFYEENESEGKEGSITLFNDLSEAIKKISEYLKAGITSDQIELSEINVGEKELRVMVKAS